MTGLLSSRIAVKDRVSIKDSPRAGLIRLDSVPPKNTNRPPRSDAPPAYTSSMATSNPPGRSNTTATANTSSGYVSDDDAGLSRGDPSSTTGLLQERLQAWKHMCGYLENYIKEVAKMQKSTSKDHDKVLKTLSSPLKEANHFDTAIGGVASLFENLRANTQAQSSMHTETEKNMTGQVLPILERLHTEIKNKAKELAGGAGKGSKAVDAARQASQKHIDALGQSSASFDSSGGKMTAGNDPYVLQRGIFHRLNKQILEENSNRQDIIAVQSSFAQFEAHVVTTVQAAMNAYNQYMSGQCDRQKAIYGDMASTTGNIPLDFEWNGFMKRNSGTLVNPNSPPETMDSITFPNQNHRSTRPLIEGSLERKHRGGMGFTGFKSNYYAVTPAGYLHEFKDNDNFAKDPVPEHSLYLPDTTIGAVDGTKFTIKGKDSHGSKISQKMSISSEYQFKAHTDADAQAWHKTIAEISSGSGSVPTSPAESRNVTPVATHTSQKENEYQSPAQASQPSNQALPERQQGLSDRQQETGVMPSEKTQAMDRAGGPTSPGGGGGGLAANSTIQQTPSTNAGGPGPASDAGPGSFHGGPGRNELAEREYVSRTG